MQNREVTQPTQPQDNPESNDEENQGANNDGPPNVIPQSQTTTGKDNEGDGNNEETEAS